MLKLGQIIIPNEVKQQVGATDLQIALIKHQTQDCGTDKEKPIVTVHTVGNTKVSIVTDPVMEVTTFSIIEKKQHAVLH